MTNTESTLDPIKSSCVFQDTTDQDQLPRNDSTSSTLQHTSKVEPSGSCLTDQGLFATSNETITLRKSKLDMILLNASLYLQSQLDSGNSTMSTLHNNAPENGPSSALYPLPTPLYPFGAPLDLLNPSAFGSFMAYSQLPPPMLLNNINGTGYDMAIANPYLSPTTSRPRSSVRQYACEFADCQKLFPSAAGLKTHILSHTKEKPFACEICPKSYTTKNRLKVHMRDHTGDKPYKCEVPGCTYATKQKCALQTHAIKHLPATDKKAHQASYLRELPCKECDKCFRSQRSLDQHIWRMHRN
ncbi:hypothetical protein BDR26DRAFT_919305 [Obelidium mucronatum]|nr:hypothetical protein BDR26DRAFT_919305 [Obelidium mucronatum]